MYGSEFICCFIVKGANYLLVPKYCQFKRKCNNIGPTNKSIVSQMRNKKKLYRITLNSANICILSLLKNIVESSEISLGN